MRDEQLSTNKLNCGRRPDPGRRRVEACAARITVRDAPADVGAEMTIGETILKAAEWGHALRAP